jgi:hypothetical protein
VVADPAPRNISACIAHVFENVPEPLRFRLDDAADSILELSTVAGGSVRFFSTGLHGFQNSTNFCLETRVSALLLLKNIYQFPAKPRKRGFLIIERQTRLD